MFSGSGIKCNRSDLPIFLIVANCYRNRGLQPPKGCHNAGLGSTDCNSTKPAWWQPRLAAEKGKAHLLVSRSRQDSMPLLGQGPPCLFRPTAALPLSAKLQPGRSRGRGQMRSGPVQPSACISNHKWSVRQADGHSTEILMLLTPKYRSSNAELVKTRHCSVLDLLNSVIAVHGVLCP